MTDYSIMDNRELQEIASLKKKEYNSKLNYFNSLIERLKKTEAELNNLVAQHDKVLEILEVRGVISKV